MAANRDNGAGGLGERWRWLALPVGLLVLAAGLALAVPDDAPTAEAHPPWEETYTYQVPVEKTREVPVYSWVTEKVRVSPYWEKYTQRFPCVTVIIHGQVGTYCPPPKTSWRQVYNYKNVTKKVQTGTRTETYTVMETRTGTRMRHDAHYEPPPTPKPTATATPKPRATATPKPRATATPKPRATATPKPRATATPKPRATATPKPTVDPPPTTPWYETKCPDRQHPYTRRGETSCHKDHDCPTGYYARPFPELWIDPTDNHVVTNEEFRGLGSSRDFYEYVTSWEKWDRVHECYKPVPVEGTKIDIITPLKRIFVDGFTYAVKGGKVVIDHAEYIVHFPNPESAAFTLFLKVVTGSELSPAEKKVKEAVTTAIKALDDIAQKALCNSIVTLSVAGSAGTMETARYVKRASQVKRLVQVATVVAKGSAVGTTVGVAVGIYCGIKGIIADSSDSDDEEATPTPTPTPTPAPTPEGDKMTRDDLNRAQKRFSDGEISVDEYKAIVFRWNCQQYGRFCDR